MDSSIINVDEVYKTVLAIINKENRGYLSPFEFNKIANQVQLSLIDKAFYDYNRAVNDRKSYGANSGYADIAKKSREKIEFLFDTLSDTLTIGEVAIPSDLYKLEGIYSDDRSVYFEELSKSQVPHILASPLAQPPVDFPVYYWKTPTNIKILPEDATLSSSDILLDYIKVPNEVRWGYLDNEQYGDYLYDPNDYTEGQLVVKENAFDSITTNISDGVDDLYETVLASVEDSSGTAKGIALLDVLVVNNAVEIVDVLSSSTDPSIVSGDVIVIQGTDLGGTGEVEITVSPENLYENSTAGSINFSLHPSEFTNLVIGILGYAGISIRDANITSLATQIGQAKEMNKEQV